MTAPPLNSTVQAVVSHLQRVVHGEEELNGVIIEQANARLSLDPSLLGSNDETIVALLPLLIQVLRTAAIDGDYSSVVTILETILAQKSFEDVVHFISLENLLDGLRSGIPPLQVAVITQVVKTEDPERLADTEIVYELLSLLSDETSSYSVSGRILKALDILQAASPEFRVALFSGHCLELITKLRTGGSLEQGRLMSLLTDVLPCDVASRAVDEHLLIFAMSLADVEHDVLLAVNKVQFYRDIFTNPHYPNLVSIVRRPVAEIAELYANRHRSSTVDSFLLNDIYAFFGALSSQHPNEFRELDLRFEVLSAQELENYSSPKSIMFLSLLSPHYVYQHFPDAIRNLPIQPHCVRALRNFVKDQHAYSLCSFTAGNLIELPYLELMALLAPLSATPWGVQDLVTWNKVMESLLGNEHVRERETSSYRREVFENLVLSPPNALSVWNEPVRRVYRELIQGSAQTEPRAAVADESAS